MMIISEKSYLVDTNIFIYAQDKKSPKFEEASRILQEINKEKFKAYISIQNLLEYAAFLTRFYKYPKNEVAVDLKILYSNQKIIKLYPTNGSTSIFLNLMEKNPKIYIHDLYLIAIMQTYGINRIITDDAGFKEFKDIEVVNPFLKS